MSFAYYLSSRSGSLPEVPWVMGDPNASYKWQVSVAQARKKDRGKRSKPNKLENIVLKIYLKGNKKSIKIKFLTKGVKEDFNTIALSSIILRAFHFSKLKNIIRIAADSEVLHNNKTKSFPEVIKILDDFEVNGAIYDHVEIEATLKPENLSKIIIDRIHKIGKPPITIAILGKIQTEKIDRIVGYIKKHVPVENIQY
jgi:hypothetical protein